MKIGALYSYRNFGSNYYSKHIKDFEDEEDIRNFANDDGYSEIRDALRAHMFSQILPYYTLNNNKTNINPKTLEDVNIRNLRKIGNSSYSGSTLATNLKYVDLLQNSNIRTVIDLEGYQNLENACNEKNIEYFKYPVGDNYWNHPIFKNDIDLITQKSIKLSEAGLSTKINEKIGLSPEEMEDIQKQRNEFIRDFKELVDVLNDGYFYISCQFGELRTPNILALNSFFNPDWMGLRTRPINTFFFDAMKKMYNNLTDEDKSTLNFTFKYDRSLNEIFNK